MVVWSTSVRWSKLVFWMMTVVWLMSLPQAATAQSSVPTAIGPGSTVWAASPEMDLEQTLSDGAQRNTIAFDGFALITGSFEAQSFFPPGKVADYWGFQYLCDNTSNGNGHNTSFLTNCAFNVLYLLNDAQFAQLKTLATSQVDQINLYGYKRFPLMKAFRRQLEGDIPAGSSGLRLDGVKAASADLYELDGQISFDRAAVYAALFKSLTPSQESALNTMKVGGFDSWTLTPSMESAVKERMKGVSQDVSVALMTYAGDLFSWYAGSLEADVYFCPERQGTYFGSFYVKDAPAIGHEGYKIDEALTATAGQKLLDELATSGLDVLVTGLVDQQRDSLYAGTTNIVQMREDISQLLRSLITADPLTDAVKTEVLAKVLAKSRTYGELDGTIVHSYAMAFAQVYQSMSASQKANMAALRKSIMSGVYNNVPFDFSVCTTPFLYSAVIDDPSNLAPYIADTDYLFEESTVAVVVSPSTATVAKGKSQQFVATVSGTSNTTVSWQVNGVPGGNASVGTISASGLYTAPPLIPSPATVTVTAVAVADNTRSASAAVTVTVAPPVAYLSFTPTAPLAGTKVTFKNNSTGSPTSWAWNFGDGKTSKLRNPSHTYSNPGTYGVTLTVTNAAGTSTRTKTIIVAGESPAAAFSFSPGAPVKGQAASFTDESTNTPTSWSWDFGDGKTSKSRNASHTYWNAGSYNVTLTATNAAGSGTLTKTVTVTVAPPAAGFTFTPTAPIAGTKVTFKSASTGSPTSWAWNFGDGKTSKLRNPPHAYSAAGTYSVSLTVSNAGGSHTSTETVTVLAPPPAAAFTLSPDAAVIGQMVTFTDATTNTPTSWSWSFGDGSTSSLQHPSHVYASAGTFTVTLTAANPGGANSTSQTVTISPAQVTASFDGNILLGSPTATSIKAKVLSPGQSGTVFLAYGTAPGAYDRQTPINVLSAAIPLELALDDLQEDMPYYYRLYFQTTGESVFAISKEYRFHTARPAGSTFTFTIQSDSHLDENSDLNLYHQTLANVLADAPDFHVDLGDTFMCDKHSAPLTTTVQAAPNQATVDARYAYERNNFGAATHSVPLFLVNGNHEGEWGWLTDGTAQNLAVWTTLARQQYFLNPTPDDFYSGDSAEEPYVGKRASWYAWEWGDALFIVLDPYWNTKTKSSKDPWALTLGEGQYHWLEDTLASSTATFKFVFIHNLVGGLDGQMRGGIEAAPFFEWGGENQDGTAGFALKRPGWSMPIHQLLAQYGVTAVFHGHDHLYARQELDGVVYQEVPQPSGKNFSNGPNLASQYHYTNGTILSSSGHIRVTVSPDRVTAKYVRAWLPKNENAQRKSGQVEDAWSVGKSGSPAASFSFSPTAPVNGQKVSFTGTSTGNPTSWSWDFGDGATSTLQNPSHVYASAGTYTVTLTAGNDQISTSVSHMVTVVPAGNSTAFGGNIVLGSPTANSIKANVFAPTQSGTVYLAYGTAPDVYVWQTVAAPLQAATPLELVLDDLQEDTRYYYRLYFQAAGQSAFDSTDEYTFHTARPPGSTFTFCLQGDSHHERTKNQFHADLYQRTLLTAAADKPDFYLTMGDDFSVDTLDPTTVTAGKVTERYTLQRPFLGLIGRSAPVFLVNGNHEQAARYLLNGTPNNVAVWAQNARNTHYSQPAPDGFYTGNSEAVPYIGLLRNFYAWTWGDALFVTIDPYWASSVCVDAPFGGGSKPTNLWDVTHGDVQYQWLKTTLEQSSAKYKFVFAHHVLGGRRGGIELAGQYEWGGQNKDGSWGFTANRPGWASPIHQLMADNKVTIFFQGHDHIWVRQQLDGVTYQTLSEPADPNYALYNADAYLYGDKLPNTGYTRVTVSPANVKVDYVRTYLPKDEGSGKISGDVAFSYSIP